MSASIVFRSIAVAGFIAAGCANRDCLPPPVADDSPPDLTLTIRFLDPASGLQTTRVVTAADSTLHVDARNAGGVTVVYTGRDAEGLRRLHLGATILTTVGVGIESRKVSNEPLTSACPVAELTGT
ncbi:MAG: hypothetical protein HKN13_15235, partial [Rhodothermales bacterium]|nr:hypothetical protein [Rhodothermales bacterium]